MVSGEIFITGSYGKYKYLEQELYKLYIRASTCFSQLHGLSIEIDKVDTDLLYKMSQLFDVQRKLKSVSFEFHIKKGPTCKELSEALARKGNTINKLNLRSILKKNFKIIYFKFFLCLNGLSCFKESATLVEKTRGDISQVNIYTVAENTGIFIKAIANNCSNIEQLSTYLVPEDFDYVKSLLLNCKNLIYLGLNSLDYLRI
ncbi:hypothetical protein GLOIN_2v1781297 [Rhizophagus irregularis DAOM 181602=DAOM 197198]|nr:hypothetical protein GLOIN_2v1781297 [Rhizophagus irregularis DAOM 181602=DAOM 197198]